MDTEAVKALLIGIEAEKESLRRYLESAWTTRDPAGRAMFIRLATDEFEHMRLLEGQQASLERSGAWQPVEVPPSFIEELVPKLSKTSLRIRGTSGQNDRSALEEALELETRARDFYYRQARSADSDAARTMFFRLADMEQAHVELVQAELDNIQRDGFWFGMQEFTLESERT